MSAYRLTMSCLACLYHCQRSRHIVVYVLCSPYASVCSFSGFVISRWCSVLVVGVLVCTAYNSGKCRGVVSLACAFH